MPRYQHNEENWEQRFEELKDYRKKYGNCIVPWNYQHNKQLATWVSTQRVQYKRFQKGEHSVITKERIVKLKSLDFVWNVGHNREGLLHDEFWEKRFIELKDYRKKYGNCLVPQRYQQNKKLGAWVNRQRNQFKKFQKGEHSTMTIERISKLKSIGFDFVAPSRSGNRKRENEEGSSNNHSTAVKLQSENRVDGNDHQNKRQRRQQSDVYRDIVPSSSLSPTEAAIVDERSTESRTEEVQHHFRDECLAIALIRADREVWGIIHSYE